MKCSYPLLIALGFLPFGCRPAQQPATAPRSTHIASLAIVPLAASETIGDTFKEPSRYFSTSVGIWHSGTVQPEVVRTNGWWFTGDMDDRVVAILVEVKNSQESVDPKTVYRLLNSNNHRCWIVVMALHRYVPTGSPNPEFGSRVVAIEVPPSKVLEGLTSSSLNNTVDVLLTRSVELGWTPDSTRVLMPSVVFSEFIEPSPEDPAGSSGEL